VVAERPSASISSANAIRIAWAAQTFAVVAMICNYAVIPTTCSFQARKRRTVILKMSCDMENICIYNKIAAILKIKWAPSAAFPKCQYRFS